MRLRVAVERFISPPSSRDQKDQVSPRGRTADLQIIMQTLTVFLGCLIAHWAGLS